MPNTGSACPRPVGNRHHDADLTHERGFARCAMGGNRRWARIPKARLNVADREIGSPPDKWIVQPCPQNARQCAKLDCSESA